jgi:hypothetical protein
MPTLISASAIFLYVSWEKTSKTRHANINRMGNAPQQLLLLRRAARALPPWQEGVKAHKERGKETPFPDTRTQSSLLLGLFQ